jgi:hypothetical protein
MKQLNKSELKQVNQAATEFGVLKDSNTFDLETMASLDPTGVGSLVMSFAKYGSCHNGDFVVDKPELLLGTAGEPVTRNILITAQEPVTITRITSPAFTECSIVPEADCIGRQLMRGETCNVKVTIDSRGAALDSELRIYTSAYTVVPYPIHITANTSSPRRCTVTPDVEEATNLTSIAGVWAFDHDQSRKVVVRSDGRVEGWTGDGSVTLENPAKRAFKFSFGTFAPETLTLNDTSDQLIRPGPIVVEKSGKAIDIKDGSKDNGAAVVQYFTTGAANQTFRFEPLADGTYRIVATHSGKVLDVQGGSKDGGAPIVQYDWLGGQNQRFRVEPLGGDYYRIVAAHSGKVVEVRYGTNEDLAVIQQWDWSNGAHQRFRLPGFKAAIRRPWDSRCKPGFTFSLGSCYDVPPGYAMTASPGGGLPGAMGKPCPADWRDDGTSCYPPWTGAYVASQADPEGGYTMRYPIIVTDCFQYSTAKGQSCPANFKNTGGPGGCSCEAQPISKEVKPVLSYDIIR